MTNNINKEIYIRRWLENDWESFKAIRLEALEKHKNFFGSSFSVESQKENDFWKLRLRNIYNEAIFGLYDKQSIIGLTGVVRHYEYTQDTVIFCMSYIRECYRGRGLSELLYKHRIDWARSQEGIRRILVGHRAGNELSRRANQRHGFILVSTEDMTFGNGETDKYYTYELKV